MTEAYPLQWPLGRPRTRDRKPGPFRADTGKGYADRSGLTIARALDRLQRELDLLHAVNPVISSNLELRLNGFPRSGQRAPEDPGIALYFQLAGKPHCLPCDTYTTAAHNIAAIAAHIEATRRIERHGVASVTEMFAGFRALPPPSYERPWREVLQLRLAATPTRETIKGAYRRLAEQRHPDAGGSDAMMAELNVARDAAFREIEEGKG